MKRVFISVSMSGRKVDDIEKDITEAMDAVKNSSFFKGEEIEFVHNLGCELPPNYECVDMKSPSLWYLGEAIKSLAYCDACYFVPGWNKSDGCVIEHQVCIKYGITRYTTNQNNKFMRFNVTGARL